MSTIRIDEKHQKLLDRLIANLTLKGKKTNKKKLISELIENALHQEGYSLDESRLPPLAEDPAWILLDDCFSSGIDDLSENIDTYLYDKS